MMTQKQQKIFNQIVDSWKDCDSPLPETIKRMEIVNFFRQLEALNIVREMNVTVGEFMITPRQSKIIALFVDTWVECDCPIAGFSYAEVGEVLQQLNVPIPEQLDRLIKIDFANKAFWMYEYNDEDTLILAEHGSRSVDSVNQEIADLLAERGLHYDEQLLKTTETEQVRQLLISLGWKEQYIPLGP
jgi:hypothetical protein